MLNLGTKKMIGEMVVKRKKMTKNLLVIEATQKFYSQSFSQETDEGPRT